MRRSSRHPWLRFSLALLCGFLLAVVAGRVILYVQLRQAQREFADAYWQAHHDRNVPALMELFCWDGVPSEAFNYLRFGLATELEYPLRSIRFAGPEETDPIAFVDNGRAFGPNLRPICAIHLVFENPEQLNSTYPLGWKEGRLLIVMARPLEE
jgi:hypothetical protein